MNFFETLISILSSAVSLVRLVVGSLLEAISLLPAALSYLLGSVSSLPVWMGVFGTLTIGVLVINYVIGRK